MCGERCERRHKAEGRMQLHREELIYREVVEVVRGLQELQEEAGEGSVGLGATASESGVREVVEGGPEEVERATAERGESDPLGDRVPAC